MKNISTYKINRLYYDCCKNKQEFIPFKSLKINNEIWIPVSDNIDHFIDMDFINKVYNDLTKKLYGYKKPHSNF